MHASRALTEILRRSIGPALASQDFSWSATAPDEQTLPVPAFSAINPFCGMPKLPSSAVASAADSIRTLSFALAASATLRSSVVAFAPPEEPKPLPVSSLKKDEDLYKAAQMRERIQAAYGLAPVFTLVGGFVPSFVAGVMSIYYAQVNPATGAVSSVIPAGFLSRFYNRLMPFARYGYASSAWLRVVLSWLTTKPSSYTDPLSKEGARISNVFSFLGMLHGLVVQIGFLFQAPDLSKISSGATASKLDIFKVYTQRPGFNLTAFLGIVATLFAAMSDFRQGQVLLRGVTNLIVELMKLDPRHTEEVYRIVCKTFPHMAESEFACRVFFSFLSGAAALYGYQSSGVLMTKDLRLPCYRQWQRSIGAEKLDEIVVKGGHRNGQLFAAGAWLATLAGLSSTEAYRNLSESARQRWSTDFVNPLFEAYFFTYLFIASWCGVRYAVKGPKPPDMSAVRYTAARKEGYAAGVIAGKLDAIVAIASMFVIEAFFSGFRSAARFSEEAENAFMRAIRLISLEVKKSAFLVVRIFNVGSRVADLFAAYDYLCHMDGSLPEVERRAYIYKLVVKTYKERNETPPYETLSTLSFNELRLLFERRGVCLANGQSVVLSRPSSWPWHIAELRGLLAAAGFSGPLASGTHERDRFAHVWFVEGHDPVPGPALSREPSLY